jgi:predicted GIY-YIG superfamily endonuclease
VKPSEPLVRNAAHQWNELEIEATMLDSAVRLPRRRLSTATSTSRGPGIYFIFYAGSVPCYNALADGSYPIYIGAARDLAERLGRHRSNTAPVASLAGGADLLVAEAPLGSDPAALYLEALFISRLRPCWNEPWLGGFGSRYQGRSRASQVPPPWSVVHPGRRVGTGVPRNGAEDLRRRVRAHLVATVHPALFSGAVAA